MSSAARPHSLQREIEVARLFATRARQQARVSSFIGAGAYHHYLPVGTQAGYSEQKLSHLCDWFSQLCALDHVRYSGQGLLAGLIEALKGKSAPGGKIAFAATVNPLLRKAVRSWLKALDIDCQVVVYDPVAGSLNADILASLGDVKIDTLVVQYPDFFGGIGVPAEIANWAQQHEVPLVVIANPLALSLLQAPGGWAAEAVDCVLVDTQPLGLATACAGKAPVFMATRAAPESSALLPDRAGQDMLATIMAYLERLGEQGLRSVAQQCHDNLEYALDGLLQIPQCRSKFDGARFHEVVVEFDGVDLDAVLSLCARHGIQPGFALARDYAELDSCMLVHVCETHLRADIDTMLARLAKVIEVQAQAVCPVPPRF